MELRSWIGGTLALWLTLAVAVGTSIARPLTPGAGTARRGVLAAGMVTLLAQCAHFAEEAATGFPAVVPPLLGLAPWSPGPFVILNVAWIGIWAAALIGVQAGRRLAEWPLWFLSLAGILNGVAHPALAVIAGSWVPGLFTSPVVAVAGLMLLRALARASRT